MLASDYFTYSCKQGFLKKLNWYYAVCAMKVEENNYARVNNGKYEVNVNGNWEVIEDITIDRPLFMVHDTFTVSNELFPNVDGTITAYFGRLIANYILLVYPFGNKIPFINKEFTISDIEKIIASSLTADGGKPKEGVSVPLYVSEYINFVDATVMLQSMFRLFGYSATPKSILPPPKINEFKKKVKAYLASKYGPLWYKDQIYILEYKTLLSKYDNEWLKDDPSNNRLVSGKFKANGRSRMYLTFGAELGFDTEGANPIFMEESLTDGYPKESSKLTSAFNGGRSGSYSRGKETQKGGAIAKDILRATNSIKIDSKADCGSKIYKEIKVTKSLANAMIGRYMLDGDKEVVISDPKPLIGKVIKIRSPLYCKLGKKKICGKCVGANLADHESGVMILVLDISSAILGSALKKMHKTHVKTVEFNIHDVIF